MDWLPWSSKKYDKAIRDVLPVNVSNDELSALSKEQKKSFLEKYRPNKFRRKGVTPDPTDQLSTLYGMAERAGSFDLDPEDRRARFMIRMWKAGIDPDKLKDWGYGNDAIRFPSDVRGVSRATPLTVNSKGVMPIRTRFTKSPADGPAVKSVLNKYLGPLSESVNTDDHFLNMGVGWNNTRARDLAGAVTNGALSADDALVMAGPHPEMKSFTRDLIGASVKDYNDFDAEMRNVMKRKGMQSVADMRAASALNNAAAGAAPNNPLTSARILSRVSGSNQSSGLDDIGGAAKGGLGAIGRSIKNLVSKNKKLAPVGAVASALTKGASLGGKESWLRAAVKANTDLRK